jgi:hypothetical protein
MGAEMTPIEEINSTLRRLLDEVKSIREELARLPGRAVVETVEAYMREKDKRGRP